MKLSGIFAAISTPFDHKGDLYRTKIEHNVSRWNTTSLAGYLVCSPAGEGQLLSHDEKIMVWELTAKHAAEGRTLIADVSVEGVHEAADLAQQAQRLGYHAVCARVPVPLFIQALADRSPLPVIIDARSDHSAVAALSSHPNVAGAIVNEGIKSLLVSARSGFQVLTGSAPDLWSSLQDGAHGAALPFAAAAPYAAIAIWEAFRTRENEAGLDWQSRIAHPATLVSDIFGPAGLKHALDLNGYYGGPPRLPLTPLSSEARQEIAQAFETFSGKT
jgi:4-hydroxy-2-oxoglutarate aldolase